MRTHYCTKSGEFALFSVYIFFMLYCFAPHSRDGQNPESEYSVFVGFGVESECVFC